jgi:hypothetical protein
MNFNNKKIKKMKNLKLLVLLFSMLTVRTFAQERGKMDGDKREKVEAMKIGFITQKLDLTPEEAKVFWPVYNKMSGELEAIRKNRRNDMRDAKEDFSTMTDKEVEKIVDNEIAFRQNELDIMKKYHGQFKQVLPIKKVALLYRAEEEFKRHLLSEIRKREEKPGKSDR